MSALVQAVAAPPLAQNQVPDAIHQLLNQLADAINQQHWLSLAGLFEPDALLVNLLGQRVAGDRAIVQYQQGLAEFYPQRQVHYRLLSSQPLSPVLYLLNVQQLWLRAERKQPEGVSSCPLFVVRLHGDHARIVGCNSL